MLLFFLSVAKLWGPEQQGQTRGAEKSHAERKAWLGLGCKERGGTETESKEKQVEGTWQWILGIWLSIGDVIGI